MDEARETLTALNDGFGILEERLPASTLLHRLSQWLPVGSMFVNSRLEKLQTPTLVIAGSDDNMLPTANEAERLATTLPNCTIKKITGSGHFVLDDRVNLTQLILDSPMNPFPKKKYDPILDWKVPSPEVVNEAIEGQIKIQRNLVSPVFVSTSGDGKRRKGLSALPGKEDGPLLFVANHQFGKSQCHTSIMIWTTLLCFGCLLYALVMQHVSIPSIRWSRNFQQMYLLTYLFRDNMFHSLRRFGFGIDNLRTFGRAQFACERPRPSSHFRRYGRWKWEPFRRWRSAKWCVEAFSI